LREKKAEVTLGQAAKLIESEGSPVSLIKTNKTGFLVDSLRELEESADMIVLGKRGENAKFATEHLGSTMERVARAATKPCFVASREFRPIESVLISYDDAPSSRKDVEFVKRSSMFSGARIHLVTVSPNERGQEHLKVLKEAELYLREAGHPLTCQMLHGDTAPSVIDYVKENEIDMLVMGAYGLTRIRRLIIGSSTTEMLRGCQLPTLLFR
jgi:nucleotide-binding universal stress UspA family protein